MVNEKKVVELSEQEKKEKTLNLSIKEGGASSVMAGAGEAYIVPYALALNASNVQIGFLSSFVGLFGSLSQIFGSRLVYKYSRKKIILVSVFLQATMWLLMILLGILFIKGMVNGYAATLLVIIYCLYAIIGNFGGPAWFSLMGDLTEGGKKGEYFSKRNRITGTIALVVTFISAFVLDYTKQTGMLIIGFVILFAIASIGRYIAVFFLSKHYYPKNQVKKESYFGFFQFVKKSPTNNFGKFVIYVALVNMATNFAAPFFAVYMLKDLHFSYTWFMIVTLSSSLFTIGSMSFWGRISDKYGNRKLLQIGSLIIPFAPFLWLFSGNPIYLIFTAQIAGGVGWAAFNLAASNFIYDSVTPQRRAICVAYFNVVNGLGVFTGALLGGLFAQFVHVSFMNTFLLIFLISGVLRILIVAVMLPKVKEVKDIKRYEEENVSLAKYAAVGSPRPFYTVYREVLSTITNGLNLNNKKKKTIKER